MVRNGIKLTHAVLNNANMGLWAIEMDEGAEPRMFVDEVTQRLLGVTGEITPQEIYHAWYDNIHPAHYAEVDDAVHKAASGMHVEVLYPWFSNGEQRYARSCGVRNFEYTKGVRLEGLSQDISEVVLVQKQVQFLQEKNARSALEQKRFENILTALGGAYESIYYVNIIEDTFTVFRRAEYLRESHPVDESSFSLFIRERIVHDVHPDDRYMMYRATDLLRIQEQLRTSSRIDTTFRDVHNGRPQHYEMRIVRPKDYDEQKNVIVAFLNRQEYTQKELRQREALDKALRLAKAASVAKSTFLFNMSHDIRTPMNAIIGFTDMAQKHIDDKGRVMDCLDKVKTSSDHLLSLINDVLDMSRIESGKIVIEESVVDIGKCMLDLEQMVIDSAKQKNVELVIRLDSSVVHRSIYADELRVNRVMINVLTNAIKYTNPGGKVEYVASELPSDNPSYARYQFVVRDTGIGMSEKFLTHVYEAFSREQTSTVSGIQGTGLGLSITKELVELMGGSIDIQSSLGQGTTVSLLFEFRLAEEKESETAETSELDAACLVGKRILLVEDNELNREIAKDILEDFGMVVDEAEDGIVAVQKCAEALRQGPEAYHDAILMDIQMPIMDGYKATREIRSLIAEGGYHVPIIAMTANAFAEDMQKALDAGMDVHLAKPINVEDLIQTLIPFAKKRDRQNHRGE